MNVIRVIVKPLQHPHQPQPQLQHPPQPQQQLRKSIAEATPPAEIVWKLDVNGVIRMENVIPPPNVHLFVVGHVHLLVWGHVEEVSRGLNVVSVKG